MLAEQSSVNDSTEIGDASMCRLLFSMEALVVTLSPKGTITECNAICEKICGYSEEELVGRDFAEAISAVKDAKLLKSYISQLAKGQARNRLESLLLTRTGDCRRIRWSGVRLQASRDTLPILLLAGIDITHHHTTAVELDRTRQEKKLLQKKVFELKGVSHSLREPMTERRSEQRMFYAHHERVAPFEHRMPRDQDFQEVEFNNLGARGCGFFLAKRPATQHYVVELVGTSAEALYLTAAVKHVTRNEDGKFQVGCMFTGRLSD